jgi:protease I
MAQDLNGRRVAILATDGFEQIELTSPRETLEKAGAKCLLISPMEGAIQGFKHLDKADKLKVELPLWKADAKDFDAVLLPGGVINSDAIRIEEKAQHFLQDIDRAGKPIFVICHGGWLLINAGLVKGHTITTWPTLEVDMRNAGANWKDEPCVRDRNWVSSRKPDDLPAFNAEIVKCLAAAQPGKPLRAETRERPETRT